MEKEKSTYPDVMLRIDGGLYVINSRYIISIMKQPKYNRIPGAPKEILGVIDFRGEAIPLIDMRTLFSLKSVNQEYNEFVDMLDKRKDDHIRWVKELERSILENEEIKLETDPHKCAFGQWYYNFQSDSPLINFHMKKIEDPHRKLHESVHEVHTCGLEEEDCLDTVINKAKNEYMPQILSLLDDAKEIFQTSYSEMAIVMSGKGRKIAIVIDDVISVENLTDLKDTSSSLSFNHSNYICGVKQKEDDGELILELNDDLLLEDADHIETSY